MKLLKSSLNFLLSVTLFLLFCLPVQGQPMTIDEMEVELEMFEMNIEECEEIFAETAERPFVREEMEYILEDAKGCDYNPDLMDMENAWDQLNDPDGNPMGGETEKKKIEIFKAKLDELKNRNEDLQKRWKEFAAGIEADMTPTSKDPVISEVASDINQFLKKVLETVFGQLNARIMYEKEELWGRVIGLDYELPEGKRLDDNWGDKAVDALARYIRVKFEGNEVRGDQQSIAGHRASHIQCVASQQIDEPDAIACTVNILP